MNEWGGCYDDGWRDLIVSEAFAHPAKIAFGLARRIYEHATAEGWLKRDDLVVEVSKEILDEIQKEVSSGQYRRIE